MKKWSVWLTSFLVAALMIAGMCAIAAEYGSRSDPLVTLSYINDVVLPDAKEDVDEALEDFQKDLGKDLEKQTEEINKHIDKKLKNVEAGDVDDELVEEIANAIYDRMSGGIQANASWALTDVPAGYTVLCDVGAQVILRQGQATCYSYGAQGLIDLSDGTTLENGKELNLNHLYAVSATEQGMFTQNGCSALISGGYTLR